MKRRLLSLLLVCVMLCTMLPVSALAEGGEDVPAPETVEPAGTAPAEAEAGPEATIEPVIIVEPEAAPEPETTAEPEISEQAPAEPAQTEPVTAAPANIAAPAAEAPALKGTLSASYVQRSKTTGDAENKVTISLLDCTWQNDFTVTLKGPGIDNEQNITSSLTATSSARSRYYTLDNPKAGQYTVKVTDPATKTSIQNTFDVYEVTFHTGTDGQFVDGKTEHTAYGGKYSFYFQLVRPDIKVTAQEKTFLGWSTTESSQSANFSQMSDAMVKEGNKIDLYAVYGTPKTYSFKLTANDQELKHDGTFTFPAKDIGYKSESVTFIFTNTGNQELTFGRIGSLSNFESSMGSSFNLGAGETQNITITPKSGLTAGTYNEDFQIMYDSNGAGRGLYRYHLTFTVNSGNILITPPKEAHKPYGESWNQSNLEKITATHNQSGGGEVDYSRLGLTLESAGFAATAEVKPDGGYYTYTLQVPNSVSFQAKLAEGEYKLFVDPVKPEGTATAGQVVVGAALGTASLSGTFKHQTKGWAVSGSLTWENPEEILNEPGIVQKTWVFTPSNANYTAITGTTEVVVSNRTETTVTAPSETSFVYDGQPHPLQFTCSRDGDIEVWYRPNGSQNDDDWTKNAPVNAGTYEVKAMVQASGIYAAGLGDTVMSISQRPVTLNCEAWGKVYDGTKEVRNPTVAVWNTVGGDKVEAVFTAELDSADTGGRIATFEITGLKGPNAANYTLPLKTRYLYDIRVEKKTVTIKGNMSKEYGLALPLTGSEFKVDGLLAGDSLSDLGAVFTCEGLSGTADVGTYPITVALNSTNYQLPYVSGVLVRDTNVGTLTVNKATPQLHSNIVVSSAKKGALLSSVTVAGEYVNPNNETMVVKGSFRWKDPSITMPTDKNSYEAEWVFELEEGYEKNYNIPEGGTVIITLADKEPLPMTAEAQTVVYDGQPKKFTNYEFTGEEPDAVTLLYRKHTDLAHAIALFSVGNEWTNEEPVDAGTYDVAITGTAMPNSDYASNSIEAVHLTILPATPTFVGEQSATVPEGTLLSDPSVVELMTVPTGVDGKTLDGTFSWTTPNVAIAEDGESFQWFFTPDSGNYSSVAGTVTFTLAEDIRTIQAAVYNLPGNHPDYAVVNLDASGLKLGDKVTFYRDAACTDPESQPTVVAQEDVAAGTLTVNLDVGALAVEGGTIYARITSVQKNEPSAMTYGAEPTLTLLENGIVCDDGEINLPEVGGRCQVAVALQGEGYTVEKIEYGLQQSGSAFTVTDEGLLTAASGGEAVLTATVTLKHPDPAKAGENIVLSVQAKVICHGVVKDKVQSDQALSGTLAGGSSLLDSVMSPEDIKRAEDSGAVVEVVLSVQAVEQPADAGKVEAACGNVYTVGQYMAIDLTRYVIANSVSTEDPITETSKPLTIQVKIPEALVAQLGSLFDKEFAVARVHDGISTILPDLDNDPYTVTFESRLFSTYALVYKDSTERGSLTITNTVTGNKADSDKEFTYTLTVTYPGTEAYGNFVLNGKYGEMEFANGAVSFTLKGGESVTVTDLPAGGKYTVKQETDTGYYTTSKGTTGTIADQGQHKAEFTNRRDIFTVTFDPNGGKLTGSSKATTGPDGKLGSLPKAAKDGEYFAGWYTAKTGGTKVSVDTVYSGDTTLYARWSKTPITGDENNIVLWGVLLGVSAVAICAGAVILLRKKKKK